MYQCFFLGPLPLHNSFLEKEKKLLQLLLLFFLKKEKKQKLQQLLLLLQEGVMKRKWSKEEALVHPSPPPISEGFINRKIALFYA